MNRHTRYNYANQLVWTDWNKGKRGIQNTYEGTAVLMANGVSLRDAPMEFLTSNKTIGTNNIYLYGLTDEEVEQYPNIPPKFQPNFYTILGYNQVDTMEKQAYCRPLIEGADLAFVNRIAYSMFDFPHVYGIHGIRLSTRTRPTPKTQFSYNIMDNIGIGFTNTYIMFQILYYLGFSEVLCVGLDNDYSVDPDRLHFYPNDKRFACEPGMGRSSHQKGSNYVFGLAKEAYEKDGRKIININNIDSTPFEWRKPKWLKL